MRNMVFVCISLLVVGIVSSEAQSASMGLVGAWLFDEGSGNDTKDSVGNNHGEIMGNLKWADGKLGKALEFAGAGDSYVSIPHNDYMDADPYTITAWVKLEAASWQYIAWRDGLVWPEPRNKRHTDIWVADGSNIVVLMWHTEAGGEGRIDGKTAVADGNWHHVAKSSDSDNMMLYIDGELDGESPIGGQLAINGEDPLWIGARPGNVAATGIIDEVGFFTEALSGDQLKEVMAQGLEPLAAVEPSNKLASTWGKLKTRH
ncbi:LamG domain-containing protein [Candidatus Poribacteria bacterium]